MLKILNFLKPTEAPLRTVEPITAADEHILVLLVQGRKGDTSLLLHKAALPRISTPIGADADEATHTAEAEVHKLLGPKARLEGAIHLAIARKKVRDVQVVIAQLAGSFPLPAGETSLGGEIALRHRETFGREERQLLRFLYLKGHMPGGNLFPGWQSEWQPFRNREAA